MTKTNMKYVKHIVNNFSIFYHQFYSRHVTGCTLNYSSLEHKFLPNMC